MYTDYWWVIGTNSKLSVSSSFLGNKGSNPIRHWKKINKWNIGVTEFEVGSINIKPLVNLGTWVKGREGEGSYRATLVYKRSALNTTLET